MCTSLLVVDVPSVSKSHYDDQKHLVFDRVDDAVTADPDTKAWPPLESSRTGRSRVLGKQGDCALDATTNLRVELAQGAGCRRTEFDCDSRSLPAKVSLDLLPGDVRSLLGHRRVEGRDDLGVLQGCH